MFDIGRCLGRSALAVLLPVGGVMIALGCGEAKKPMSGPPTAPRHSVGGDFQLNLSQIPEGAADKVEVGSVGIFFCLDTSGSMAHQVGGKRKIDISKEAMRQVFTQIGAYAKANPKKNIRVGLCNFSDSATIRYAMGPFDQAGLEKAIEPLQPHGGTAIGGAMGTAVLELLKAGVESRAVIVMTDGENTAGPDPAQVVGAIRNDQNTSKIPTNDIKVFLVAFDVNAGVFAAVKQAGATVKESRDQKSLESMLNIVVEEALLEAPSK